MSFFHSTPFKLNSTIRCSIIVLYEMVATSSAMLLVSLVLAFLFGLVSYTDACLLDINSIFGQMNRFSTKQGINKPKSKITQSTQREIREKYMLECCKEVVILHERLNRYFQMFNHPFVILISPFLSSDPNHLYFRCLRQLAHLMNGMILMTIMPYTICICSSMLIIETVP